MTTKLNFSLIRSEQFGLLDRNIYINTMLYWMTCRFLLNFITNSLNVFAPLLTYVRARGHTGNQK